MMLDTSTTIYNIPAVCEVLGAVSATRKAEVDLRLGVSRYSVLLPAPDAVVLPAANNATSSYVSLQWGPEFASLFAKLDALEDNSSLTPSGAPTPNRQSIALARIILKRFHLIATIPDRVVASVEGGVAICFAEGNKYSDIECLNEGALLGVTTNRRDRPTVWEIDPSAAGISNACARVKNFIARNTASAL